MLEYQLSIDEDTTQRSPDFANNTDQASSPRPIYTKHSFLDEIRNIATNYKESEDTPAASSSDRGLEQEHPLQVTMAIPSNPQQLQPPTIRYSLPGRAAGEVPQQVFNSQSTNLRPPELAFATGSEVAEETGTPQPQAETARQNPLQTGDTLDPTDMTWILAPDEVMTNEQYNMLLDPFWRFDGGTSANADMGWEVGAESSNVSGMFEYGQGQGDFYS
jgi:hypothetical protein